MSEEKTDVLGKIYELKNEFLRIAYRAEIKSIGLNRAAYNALSFKLSEMQRHNLDAMGKHPDIESVLGIKIVKEFND